MPTTISSPSSPSATLPLAAQKIRKAAGSFTLTNTAKKAVEASSLTVVKNSKRQHLRARRQGEFSVGKLTNQGTVKLGATDSSSSTSTVGKLIIHGRKLLTHPALRSLL